MKNVFVMLLLLSISPAVMSQQPSVKEQYFLTKAKKQKTAGYVFLFGGITVLGLGLLVGNNPNSSFSDAQTGTIIAGAGVASMLGSVPLFIAAGRNKRNALALAINFKIERLTLPATVTLSQTKFAAIAFRLAM